MTWGLFLAGRKQSKDESDSRGYPQEPGECMYWKKEVCWKSSLFIVLQVGGSAGLVPSSSGMEEMWWLGVTFHA